MSLEANKDLVRQYVERVWNQADDAAIDELVAPDFVDHEPHDTGLPSGPAGIRASVARYLTAFPDQRFELEEIIAEGDRVVTRFRCTGTQTGPLGDVPPSGKRIDVAGVIIFGVRDCKITDRRGVVDSLTLLRQIGALPG